MTSPARDAAPVGCEAPSVRAGAFRIPPRLASGLGGAAVAVPALASAWFVWAHAVDVPFWDEWSCLAPLLGWLDGHLTLRALFAQHNEHRFAAPQLLLLLLDRATALDTRARMAASWLLLAATGGLLFIDSRQSHPKGAPTLLAFAPVAWIVLSWRQWENLLWGLQITLCGCVFFLVAALTALARARSPAALLLAVSCGACASFSFATGLLIWPLGLLVLLAARPRLPPRAPVIWALCGAAVLAFYFTDYVKPAHHPALNELALHPGPGLRFFIASLGSPLAERLLPALWAGWFVVGMSATVAALVLRGRLRWRSPVPPALVLFALSSSAVLTLGRAGFGPGQGLSSRYSTFTGLGLVGLYLLLLDGSTRLTRTLAGLLLAVIAAAQPSLDRASLIQAGRLASVRRQARASLLHFRDASDASLLPLYPAPAELRAWASVLESHRLSVFRDEPRPAP